MAWDSRVDTLLHIGVVRRYLDDVIEDVLVRAERHDASKLKSPERECFDEFTPLLRDLEYGSPEYAAALEAMGPALRHHYEANGHHPEHYENGWRDMSLLDVLEMLADWKAATERMADGDLDRSISVNRDRFGYTEEFEGMLRATARQLGWLA